MFRTSMICSRNIIYLRKTLINPTVQEFHRTTVKRPFSEDTWEVITFRTYRHATAICRCHRLKKRVLITMNKWVQIIGLIFFKRIQVTKDCNRHQLLPFPLPFVDRELCRGRQGFDPTHSFTGKMESRSDPSALARGRLAVLSAHLAANRSFGGFSSVLERSPTLSHEDARPPGNLGGSLTVIDERTGKKYALPVSTEGTVKATDLKKVHDFSLFGFDFVDPFAQFYFVCIILVLYASF